MLNLSDLAKQEGFEDHLAELLESEVDSSTNKVRVLGFQSSDLNLKGSRSGRKPRPIMDVSLIPVCPDDWLEIEQKHHHERIKRGRLRDCQEMGV